MRHGYSGGLKSHSAKPMMMMMMMMENTPVENLLPIGERSSDMSFIRSAYDACVDLTELLPGTV